MNKKAVSQIAAIVILLILVVISAGTAFYWQGFIDKHERTLFRDYAKMDILGTHYNSEGLTIYMRNSGRTNIPIQDQKDPPTTLWIVRDAEYNILCSTSWSGLNEKNPLCEKGCATMVSENELHEVVIRLKDTICEPPKNNPDAVYYFTIDFSGVASATGAFIRK